ncbi:MAG: hypothetical protein JST86_20615 [Bacteroidetes bacterium]|nr:hypothetical protein [Bacteroidota bacterium]
MQHISTLPYLYKNGIVTECNMIKRLLYISILVSFYSLAGAQDKPADQDTFFLAKKKGLLGRLGKSISTFTPDEPPQKIENQFLQYKGKLIRHIHLVRVGFECTIYDTCDIKNNFGIRMANTFHRKSTENVMRHNLFFREGGRIFPFLMADNERYLRDLPYIQDARIVVEYAENSTDSVDVWVLSKDIFSLGAKVKLDTRTRGRVELQEENAAGSGMKVFVSGLYDQARQPNQSYSGYITRRNIGGSFVDWTMGYNGFGESLSSGKREETGMYTRWEKPLVTPYIASTGGLQAGYYRTNNAYVADSLYNSDFRYSYYNVDGWLGYSLDSKRRMYANKEIRIHKFAAARAFNQHFFSLPFKYKNQFDYRFTNFTGGLMSINVFKQSFYKTNFIYGFGRNEDVPEGFSLSLTGGWIKKQQLQRPYSGIDFNLTNFKRKGFYSNITFSAGSYFYRNHFEDMNILLNVDHFTRLKRLSANWFHRTFISSGITTQINPVLNAPLFINSIFGLPYFVPDNINSDMRGTIRLESVYYNTQKVLGFRFAPFTFTDGCLVKPQRANLNKSDFYSAVGGGIRTRNENLVFGTIELKAYYFPRTNADMKPWKVELSTNIRFKYNSTFIKRPDFISAN